MEISSLVRFVESRRIDPPNSDPFTVYELTVETADPLEIHTVRVTEEQYNALPPVAQFPREPVSLPVRVSVRPGGYLSLSLVRVPDALTAKAAKVS